MASSSVEYKANTKLENIIIKFAILAARLFPYNFVSRVLSSIIINKKLRKKFRRIFKKELIFIHKLQNEKSIVNDVSQKDTIKVVFFVIDSSLWQFDSLFKLMLKSERYEPYIVVIPYNIYGQEYMKEVLEKAYAYFKQNNPNVFCSYDSDADTWLDVREAIRPDIVFFTNPHKLTHDLYYIDYWHDKALTCYLPYALEISNLYEMHYNQLFHNLLWRYFNITQIHKEISLKYADNRARNVIIVGYPKCDNYLDTNYQPDDLWKIKDRSIKRIIWTPHQTIEENERELGYSCFLLYYQHMLDLAKEYEGKIQIAFKPHPILKQKLYLHPEWGQERTDEYYQRWQNLKNGQLKSGDYIDLFMTSDAMINSSVSFTAEYLFTGKPGLFTVKDDTIKNKFSKLGEMAFDKWYKCNSKEDLIDFVEHQVIRGIDPYKEDRMTFVNEHLMPPNGISAAKNIMNAIEKEIKIEKET